MKKTIISTLLIAGTALASQLAMAAPDGTITFNGNITSQTCKINGGSAPQNFTVTLPTVSTTTLNAMDATSGRTGFRIALTQCNPTTGNVHTFFEAGPTVNLGTGRLINAGSATAVEIELLNKDTSIITVGASDGIGAGLQNSKSVALAAGAANLDYYAQYHATSATGSGAGGVTSTVTYDISYN
ncbi:fimbrial protein [Cupriavidus metallidurans]|uniref:fimbrial protein n=1 Tax=Cupriavidus metallidurans TaxID=119219 RepID=UPI001646356C|nr:fimbrial protein [Cupriavidus metallidurans]